MNMNGNGTKTRNWEVVKRRMAESGIDIEEMIRAVWQLGRAVGWDDAHHVKGFGSENPKSSRGIRTLRHNNNLLRQAAHRVRAVNRQMGHLLVSEHGLLGPQSNALSDLIAIIESLQDAAHLAAEKNILHRLKKIRSDLELGGTRRRKKGQGRKPKVKSGTGIR